ncbi:ABC transporter substrate binding protein [uncultured Bacteroides sp.]|uniref:ABC transporter substrate binding protein n=1 Tax=uncultured Bacteroides sp. TaxID=162156 RepID=UPI002AA95746|nr:ABC transporter substrate binding protein [uncultured Bacteroides sp.]
MKYYKFIQIMLIFTLLSVKSQAALKNDYVLIINSYTEGDEWANRIQNVIIQEMYHEINTSTKLEYLNNCNFTSLQHANEVMNQLYTTYSNKPRSVVIIGDAGWISYRSTLPESWKKIPVLLTTVREYTISLEDLISGKELNRIKLIPFRKAANGFNVTGLYYPLYIKETIQLMKKLMPEMTKVAFISDKRFISSSGLAQFKEIRKKYYPELGEISLNIKDFDTHDLLDSLASFDKHTGVLCYGWYTKNENGSAANNSTDKIQKIIGSFTRTPVFSLLDIGVDNGTFAGGVFPTCDELGKKTVNLLLQILNGKNANEIPFQKIDVPQAQLNYEYLVRSGINKELLPEDAVYYQKPDSFYHKYKTTVTIIISCLLLLIMGFLIRIYYLNESKKSKDREILLLKKYKELYHNNEELSLLLNSIFDNIPIPLYVKEVGEDIRYTYWNKKAEEFTGLKSEDVIGKTDVEVFGEEIGKKFQEDNDRLLKKGDFLILEDYFPHVDKKLHITSTIKTIIKRKNKTSYILVTRWDISELIAIQRKLELSNRELSLVLNVGEIMPWTWDISKNEISIYDATNNGVGNPEKESIVKTLKQMDSEIHPDDLPKFMAVHDDILSGRIDKYSVDYRADHTGNGYKWFTIHGVVSKRDKDGKALIITGATYDISGRKQIEQTLIDAKEKAEESDRLKSAFISNMSHEIRTPLNAIVGFSRILASENKDNEQYAQFANIIENNNVMLLQLINDVLDLSKIEAGILDFNYSNVDINNLLSEIEQMSRLKVDQNIVKISFEDRLPECVISTDRNRLAQVINNFISNAIKFTKQGSIQFGYLLKDKQLYFYVKDTGHGISKENQAAIFDRFVKLDSFTQGTGLGLAICTSIVRKLGGDIGVDSLEGKGSTFWFTLPDNKVVANLETLKVKPTKEKEAKVHKTATLLVAEDDASNYRLVEVLLGKEYNLIHAWNGVEAVQLFKENEPDLVLMDINMPLMNGYESTKKIRKISENVPVIAVTAYATEEDKIKIMNSGFDDLFPKPIHYILLKEKIVKLLMPDVS